MTKYIGAKCSVCGEMFKDGDDIVVCPDCGTPYHRACWDKNGECINHDLHESGMSWSEKMESERLEAASHGEPIRCIRCGTENDPGTMFCVECGMPLAQGRNDARPFNGTQAQSDRSEEQPNQNGFFNYSQPNADAQSGQGQQDQQDQQGFSNGFNFGIPVQPVKLTEESDIDGIRLGDFFDYAGRRSLSLIANFVKFAKTGSKTSMNIAALFFPQYYFFYRKMYKKGILFMLLWFLTAIPTLILYGQSGVLGMVFFKMPFNIKSQAFLNICNVAQIAATLMGIFACLYANYWYYKQARDDIQNIRSQTDLSETEIRAKIAQSGGTSWAKVIIAGVSAVALSLVFLLVLTILF